MTNNIYHDVVVVVIQNYTKQVRTLLMLALYMIDTFVLERRHSQLDQKAALLSGVEHGHESVLIVADLLIHIGIVLQPVELSIHVVLHRASK